jgi:hypothetical protein
VVTALAGALVGAVATETHAVLQGLRERRRALRSILFNLLELRLAARSVDPREPLRVLTAYMQERFGRAGADAMSLPEVRQFFARLVPGFAQSVQRHDIGAEYRAAVASLAPHTPLLAYRLADRERLLQLDGLLKSYFARVQDLLATSLQPADTALMNAARDEVFNAVYDGALQELTESVLEVARALSPFTWWRARRTMRGQDRPLGQDDLFALIDRLTPPPPQGSAA